MTREDPALEQPVAQGLRVPSDTHDELVERRTREREAAPPARGQRLLGVLRPRVIEPGDRSEAAAPEQREVDRRREGAEPLVRADVRRGLAPADVLLARRERQYESALAV